ncbi:MAG: hypothetical protein P1S46_11295 [bacterium]|nr:hypothetical protein [bacterium]
MVQLQTKLISFPSHHSFGDIYVRDPAQRYDERWWASMPSQSLALGAVPQERFANWMHFGEARGAREVDVSTEPGLRVSLDISANLELVSALDPLDIQVFDLSYTPLTDYGFEQFALKMPVVKYLDLSFTFVTSGAAVAAAHLSALEILHLAFNRLGSHSLEHLGALEKLVVLNLMGTNIIEPDPSRLSSLAKLTSLQCLDLSFNKCGDKDLKVLPGFESLRILNLVNTDITDNDIETIKEIQSLRRLYLGRNRITDNGVRSLSKIGGLRSLSLSGPGVTDTSVDYLSELNYLDKLFIRGTTISRDGLKALSGNIPGCRIDHGRGDDDRSEEYQGTRITDMIHKDLLEEEKKQ